jgi:rhodanese-related sulfurtransferase
VGAKGGAARGARIAASSPSTAATLDAWRGDKARTLYLFDVRDPAEYEAGHVAGAISAPGGQLVQATDHYVGALGARIVLTDDAEVRALMTASWLRQMGWQDVYVLAEAGSETGWPSPPVLASAAPSGATIDPATLRGLLSRNAATVVDLSLSRSYLTRHIPGAWFAIRTRLDRALKKIPLGGTLVLTSEDGVLAKLAVAEAAALDRASGAHARRRQQRVAGGRLCLLDGSQKDGRRGVDQWRKPYERSGDPKAAMQEYLDWETDLLPRIARDGSLKFSSHATTRS